MKIAAGIGTILRYDPWLWAIIAGALLLRVVGIGYGLPMWLIADEPPFVLGALQMIQLHTLIPAFHPEAFTTLYYPPFLSYLYLIPFILLLGVQFLLWHGTAALFANHVLSDLTPFFMVARLWSVLLGTISIYLIYKISETLFASKLAARVSAFLLATSITHIGLSMVGRHWMPTSFIFLLTIYISTKESIPENRRALYCLIAAGIGAGFDTTAILALLPALWWYLTHGKTSFFKLLTDKLVLLGSGLFILLAALPTLLHPGGNGFLTNVTLSNSGKTLAALIESPLTVIGFNFFSEPVLVILSLMGLLFLCVSRPRFAVWALGWFVSFIAIFYIFFRLEPRFALPFMSLYALLGGYAYMRTYAMHRVAGVILLLLLLIPLVSAIRFSQLVLQNDNRVLASTWTALSLSAKDRMLVFASLTRLPTQSAAIDELRSIDPKAIRKVDEAQAALNLSDVPHTLTLYAVNNEKFFKMLPVYARDHQYTYVLYQPSYAEVVPGAQAGFASLLGHATVLASWPGTASFSLADSVFIGSFTELFSTHSLGVPIIVYTLP